MHKSHGRIRFILAFALMATLTSIAIPARQAAAAPVIYNGAGSAPRISIIGDSTIAALRWTNQFDQLKRYNFTYDAESCRRTVVPSCRGREGYAPDTTLNAMRRLSGRLGSALFIMGGYDDSSYNFGAAVDAVMAEATRQGIPTVVWLTLRSNVSYVGPGGISYSGTFRAINRILLQKAIQYGPRLQIADWAAYSANRPEWFYADGIHFRPGGANAVAAYISSQADRVLSGQIITPRAGQARPSAPRNLTAEVGYPIGSGRVRLKWDAPGLTGGVPITDYVIQRSWNGGATWVSLSDGVSTSRKFTVGGHTNGLTYLFRVAARNAVGWSPVSRVVAATPQPTIPSAVRSLTAKPGSGQVTLNWTIPSSSGGLPLTDYVVQRSYNFGQTWVSLSDGLSTNQFYTATGLANGATYQFRVAARNGIGWGPVSNVATATPSSSTVLARVSAPLDVTTTTTVPVTTSTTTTIAAPTSSAPPSTVGPTTSVAVIDSTIGDLVWLDVDADGMQDEDEPGIEGISVALLDATGVEVRRDVTDQFGAYELADVSAGSYVLELELPDGYGMTVPYQGADDELDSDLVRMVDELGTARTDVFVVPADPPLGLDLGLAAIPVEVEPSTTTPLEVTTTEAVPTSEATTTETSTTESATTQVPTTEAPITAAPTTQAPTTSAAPNTTVAAPTTTATKGG